jgi:hypothetical protein
MGGGSIRTATGARKTTKRRRKKRKDRRDTDTRRKSDLRMAWEMSSGSLGGPREAAGIVDEKEGDDEDDDDDDADVPMTDWRKAWALSSSLGCDSGVVGGKDIAFLDVDGHVDDKGRTMSRRRPPTSHEVGTARDDMAHRGTSTTLSRARTSGYGDFRQAWALSSSLGCRRDVRSDIVVDDDDDIDASIVASVGGRNDIEKNDQTRPSARPRLDSGDSSTSTSVDNAYYSALCTPTPRMARYLCASSVLLAVCSLGLAATGLGLMYFSTTGDDGSGGNGSNLSGGGGIGGIDGMDSDMLAEMTAETQELEELLMDVGFESGAVGDEDVGTDPKEVEEEDVGTDQVEALSSVAPSSTKTDVPTYNPTLAPIEPTPTASPSMRPILLEAPATLLSTTLYSIADTWLEYNGTQPHGSNEYLKVDGVDPRASLLKFNFSSIIENVRSTDDIVGFMLRLYSITDGPFGGKIDLLDGDCNDWDEDTVSWINAPECVFRNDSEYLVGLFEEEIPPHEWNEAVIFPNFDGNNGGELPIMITLRVSSHYPDGITYASRENVTAIPELVVYYTEPAPTGSPTIAAPSEGPTRAPSSSPIVPTPTMSPLKAPTGNPTVSF